MVSDGLLLILLQRHVLGGQQRSQGAGDAGRSLCCSAVRPHWHALWELVEVGADLVGLLFPKLNVSQGCASVREFTCFCFAVFSVLHLSQQILSYRTGKKMQESFGSSLNSKPSLADVLAKPKPFSEEPRTLTVSHD